MKSKYYLIFILSLFAAASVSAQPFAGRDAKPDATRDAYLRSAYDMSDDQCSLYTQALREEYDALAELYSKNISQKESDAEKRSLFLLFKDKVRQILTPAQYAVWAKTNKTNHDRQYHEYLGLDADGVDALNAIIEEYKTAMSKIYKGSTIYSKIEIAEIKKDIEDTRNEAISKLIGEAAAQDFVSEYDLYRQARIIHRAWTFLSFDKAKQLSKCFVEHSKAKYMCLLSNGSAKEIKKTTKELRAAREAAVKSILTEAEYAKFVEVDELRADEILKRNYRMSNGQLAKFKDVMNRRAVERRAVRKGKLSIDEKQAQFDEIDEDAKSRLQTFLRPEQVDVWVRNIKCQK